MNRGIDELKNLRFPRWNELPNIKLYVDQVVSIIEENLKFYTTVNSNEKIITKTMINNYVKQGIIPPPINKKYDKNHIAALLIICLFKKLYSINDIGLVLERYLLQDDISTRYDAFCEALENGIQNVFEKNERVDFKLVKENNEILHHVILSFVHYLYVQKIWLPEIHNS